MAYTTIDDPSVHFQTVLYTGSDDASATKVVTNDGNSDLQPDWLWFKRRNASVNHAIQDTSRGIGNGISSSTTGAEVNDDYGVTAISSDGFSVRENAQATGEINQGSMVCWQWKANGGTTTTNDASATSVGTIDSVYQANTTAGFSIVTYTGTGSAGTIAHGLGATPHWVLVKNRSTGSTQWYNQHIGNSSASKGQSLSTDGAEQTLSAVFGDTRASSTVFTVGDNNSVNNSGDDHVAYIFAPIKGYSSFNLYTGNGNTDGPFVYTGFRPAFAIIKRRDNTTSWRIMDTKRDSFNVMETRLFADVTNADTTGNDVCDFLSNGFKIRSTNGGVNNSGSPYICIVFAEHPLVSSKGVPTTAR